MQMRKHQPTKVITVCVAVLFSLVRASGAPSDRKGNQEAGEFKISLSGKEIGSEKYVVVTSQDSIQSTSVISFRNPQNVQQKINLETKLAMTRRFTPLSYELRGDVGGKKGTIIGKFSPNQAIFEYSGSGESTRRGLLVGDQYTVLDTNVFHHFVFLARLYMDRGKSGPDRYEVVIPQENESGFLKITELDRGTIPVGGRKIKTRHLRVDSGSVQIELWVDDQGMLRKISVPARQIEVVRSE
jgi:hypothetical protein